MICSEGRRPRGLTEAIRTILKGTRYVSPAMSAKVVDVSLDKEPPKNALTHANAR